MSLKLQTEFPDNHINCIWCVKFHPIKQIFASCGSDASIIIWEYDPSISNYKKATVLSEAHTKIIRSLDWDYSGKYLSAASFDNKISIWKITNDNQPYKFSCISILDSNDSEIKSVSWSISGNLIASCSRKGNIWIWERNEDGDEINGEDYLCKSTFEAHKGDVKMVKFSPREDILFSCSFDETIKIWDFDYSNDDYILINTLKNHGGTVWWIEFNKIGDKFFTCSDDKSIIMWSIDFNCEKGENPYNNIVKLNTIENMHRRPIYCCVLSMDEKYIFTGSNDGDIGIAEINGEKMNLINKEKDPHGQYNVNSICVNKNGKEIISCGDDCYIKIWKFENNNAN